MKQSARWACVGIALLISGTALNVNAAEPKATTGAALSKAQPKRITLKSGESQATENVILKSGQAAQFVIRGKIGQILMIDADSKDLEIKMVKGKDAAQMSEPGHYDSTLVANGDFVFQVKNTAKGEVKAALNVLISDTGASKR